MPSKPVAEPRFTSSPPRTPSPSRPDTTLWERYYQPRSPAGYHYLNESVRASVRSDRCDAASKSLTDDQLIAAASDWTTNRQKGVKALSHQLPYDPAAVLVDLNQTSMGCDWLVSRWEWLGGRLETNGDWSPLEKTEAFVLLGCFPETGGKRWDPTRFLVDAGYVYDEVEILKEVDLVQLCLDSMKPRPPLVSLEGGDRGGVAGRPGGDGRADEAGGDHPGGAAEGGVGAVVGGSGRAVAGAGAGEGAGAPRRGDGEADAAVPRRGEVGVRGGGAGAGADAGAGRRAGRGGVDGAAGRGRGVGGRRSRTRMRAWMAVAEDGAVEGGPSAVEAVGSLSAVPANEPGNPAAAESAAESTEIGTCGDSAVGSEPAAHPNEPGIPGPVGPVASIVPTGPAPPTPPDTGPPRWRREDVAGVGVLSGATGCTVSKRRRAIEKRSMSMSCRRR